LANISFFSISVMTAGFALALSAMLGAIGQGLATSKAVEGIGRNPEASGRILTTLVLGLAFIETLSIYVLVISLILLFANPFIKYVAG
jgi:F-type H+-transporting ATPase subunit c